MNILKMGTAIVSAVALFATPVVASAASTTKASAAAEKLGKRLGNRSNASLAGANSQASGETWILGVIGGLALIGGILILVDKDGKPVSG